MNSRQTNSTADESAILTVVRYFNRNGYLRRPNEERRKNETRTYKKGYEVRLVAMNEEELEELRTAICKAGLKPGKPFSKVKRWVQPIYGLSAMEQFVGWIDQFENYPNPTIES